MKRTSALCFVGALCLVSGSAFAGETFGLGTVQPAVGTAANANTLAAGDPTFTSVGGYQLTCVRYTGTITEINTTTGDYLSENRLRLWQPGLSIGAASTMTLTPAGSGYVGPIGITGYAYLASGFDPAGTWSYRFYNSVDDTPTGQADSEITNVQLDFNFSLTAPNAIDLGLIGDTQANYATPDKVGHFSGGGIQWFKFTIGAIADPLWLDIDTGDNGHGAFDTEFAVFRSDGYLIGNDDDSGPGAFSAMSFGQTTPPRGPIGNGAAGNGRNGNLAAGTYYLAAGLYNSSFAHGFGASTTATGSADFDINFRTNSPVPEPASVLALGLGALVLLRRCRK